MINPNLQAIAQKILKRLKRQDKNFSLTLEQVRQEITQISKEYTKFTSEMEEKVMDILKNKNENQMSISSHNVTSVDDENLTQESSPKVSDSEMVVSQSQQITFNDDFQKAAMVKSELQKENIILSRNELFAVSDSIGNDFVNKEALMLTVMTAIGRQTITNNQEYAEKISGMVGEIKDSKAINHMRVNLIIKENLEEIQKDDWEGQKHILECLSKGLLGNKKGDELFKSFFPE